MTRQQEEIIKASAECIFMTVLESDWPKNPDSWPTDPILHILREVANTFLTGDDKVWKT